MGKLRQKANGRLPKLGQKTPDAPPPGETLSETNIAPVAFSLNQSSTVCLPVVSDSRRLTWVHSNEINLQLGGAAELNKAFDKFPYLTKKQTAALAQRCSLHPDQVKVWFMVQRLRYGISWDYNDIYKVQRKFKSNRGKEERDSKMREEDGGEKKKCKGEVKESEKAGEVREEHSANEGRMMGENAMANEQSERKMKQEQVKKERDRKVEDKGKTQKKQKMMTVSDKMGMKRKKQGDKGVERAVDGEIRSDEVQRKKSTQSETTFFTRKTKKAKAKNSLLTIQEWPAHHSFVAPDEPLDTSPLLTPVSQTQAFDVPPLTDDQTELLKRVDAFPPSTSDIVMTPVKGGFEWETETEGDLHAESTNNNGAVTAFNKLKELIEVLNIPLVAEGLPSVTQQQDSPVDACPLPTLTHCYTKKQTQLVMMKTAFSHCQYPDREDYSQLATMIDIPRCDLVQWFSDTRYYIKKARPRWMTQEQHSKALANIRSRQYLQTVVRMQRATGRQVEKKLADDASVAVQ